MIRSSRRNIVKPRECRYYEHDRKRSRDRSVSGDNISVLLMFFSSRRLHTKYSAGFEALGWLKIPGKPALTQVDLKNLPRPESYR